MNDFFEGMATLLSRRGDTSNRVAPAQELFAHIAEVRDLSLLTWWIDHGTPGSPAEMDDLYHGLVWSGVDARTER